MHPAVLRRFKSSAASSSSTSTLDLPGLLVCFPGAMKCCKSCRRKRGNLSWKDWKAHQVFCEKQAQKSKENLKITQFLQPVHPSPPAPSSPNRGESFSLCTTRWKCCLALYLKGNLSYMLQGIGTLGFRGKCFTFCSLSRGVGVMFNVIDFSAPHNLYFASSSYARFN